MRILFISNGIYEYDGRLRELISISKDIGETTYITRVDSITTCQDESHVALNSNGKLNYVRFIIKAINIAMNMKDIDILFIDNRKAIIPGLIIRSIKKPTVIIQDTRELYLINEVKHLEGKIGCFFEKLLIRKANILICANSYRSKVMMDIYSLKELPLVYENIRKLSYDYSISMEELEQKFGSIVRKDAFKIISTAGYDISRTSDRLVLAMKELGEKFELLLVGGGSKEDHNQIKEIINNYDIKNVHLIGKVGENELKYLINQCQVGVVNYNKKDMNNRLCASGKIYEFIYEGLPVITTENLPLVELVEKHSIGIADDNYAKGITAIYQNYSLYMENVKQFAKNIDVEKNNQQLINNIRERLTLL